MTIDTQTQQDLPLFPTYYLHYKDGTQNSNNFKLKVLPYEIDTICKFWKVFNKLKISELRIGLDIKLSKKGIIPVWEDENNKNGFNLTIKLSKGVDIDKISEIILLDIIRNGFPHSELINCLAIHPRYRDYRIELWLCHTKDMKKIDDIKDFFADIVKIKKSEIRFNDHAKLLKSPHNPFNKKSHWRH